MSAIVDAPTPDAPPLPPHRSQGTPRQRAADRINWLRLMLILPAGISLLAGLNAGLLLLGLPAPVATDRLPLVHGMVLVGGFLGTVIALERAVALGRWYGYSAPLSLGIGALLLLSPAPLPAGSALIVLGAILLTVIYLPLWRRQPNDAVLVQMLGAVLLVGAALLWLRGLPIAELLPWLAGFPILTIAGERLEQARLQAPSPGAQRMLTAIAVSITAAAAAALLWPAVGYRLYGAAVLVLLGWLARYDVARKLVLATGLPRFTAICLLSGYAWLTVAALLWLNNGAISHGEAAYDAVIHAVFLGFVMAMIMAHAPIILPAVLRCRLPYSPLMYVPVALLQVSLFIRVAIGDGHGGEAALRIGAVGNAIALLLFAAVVIWRVGARK